MTFEQIRAKLQEILDAINQGPAVDAAEAAIAGALGGALTLPPIRRDAQGVDHPELADWPEELHSWASEGIELCDEAIEAQQGGGA